MGANGVSETLWALVAFLCFGILVVLAVLAVARVVRELETHRDHPAGTSSAHNLHFIFVIAFLLATLIFSPLLARITVDINGNISAILLNYAALSVIVLVIVFASLSISRSARPRPLRQKPKIYLAAGSLLLAAAILAVISLIANRVADIVTALALALMIGLVAGLFVGYLISRVGSPSHETGPDYGEGPIECPNDDDHAVNGDNAQFGKTSKDRKSDKRDRLNVAYEAPSFSYSAPKNASGGIFIHSSVGRGGANNPADVAAIAQRFQELGYNWISTDERGKPSESFFLVIQMFQNIINGKQDDWSKIRSPYRDGLISPGRRTETWLARADAPKWLRLEDGGPSSGFLFNPGAQYATPAPAGLVDPSDGERWGTSWLIDTIRAAGQKYLELNEQSGGGYVLINVHELSYRTGGQSGHGSHYNGVDVDIRLPRNTRKNHHDVATNCGRNCRKSKSGGLVWFDATDSASRFYDRDATRKILKSFDLPNVKLVLFNDEFLISEPAYLRGGLCTPYPNHHNHIHLRVRGPLI